MRQLIMRAVLMMGVTVSACGSPEQEAGPSSATDSRIPDVAADSSSVSETSDFMGMHAEHPMPSPGPGATGMDATTHAGHTADAQSTGGAPVAAHDVHMDASRQHASGEAAKHAAAGMPDTGHAVHAVPDTSHYAHAQAVAEMPPGHAGAMPDMGRPVQEQGMMHRMWMQPLGGGWNLMGMAQAFPIVSTSLNPDEGTSLDKTELYLTEPAIMFNVGSPGSRVTLRTTLNFEGLTQPDGELTFGGWGESFLDKRHPHTLLHEFMLSVNFRDVAGGALSISGGKGFAPYGTDDPMSRPAVKYPTNHHLSQILERWTVNGVYLNGGWGLEAAVFGGAEPEEPYDFSNIESFGDSWSARLTRRFGGGTGPMAEWEASASFGRVREVHEDEPETTNLYNAALRHDRMYSFGSLYGLAEGSVSRPEDGDGYFSVLGETRLDIRRHQPYYRIEYATRPEYAREGVPGTDEFFRYDHDAHAIGSTRWLINTLGYGYELTGYPVSARPFVELQYNRASEEDGGIDPQNLFGKRDFWGLSAGFRVFLGGDPMRMGSYGVLDAMTSMHRAMPMPAGGGQHTGHQ